MGFALSRPLNLCGAGVHCARSSTARVDRRRGPSRRPRARGPPSTLCNSPVLRYASESLRWRGTALRLKRLLSREVRCPRWGPPRRCGRLGLPPLPRALAPCRAPAYAAAFYSPSLLPALPPPSPPPLQPLASRSLRKLRRSCNQRAIVPCTCASVPRLQRFVCTTTCQCRRRHRRKDDPWSATSAATGHLTRVSRRCTRHANAARLSRRGWRCGGCKQNANTQLLRPSGGRRGADVYGGEERDSGPVQALRRTQRLPLVPVASGAVNRGFRPRNQPQGQQGHPPWRRSRGDTANTATR